MSMEMNKALDLLREIRPSIPKEVLELWCKDRDAFIASHPAAEQAGGDERAAFEAAFAAMGRPVCRADYDQDAYGTPFDDGGWTGWQARAALAQPYPKSGDYSDQSWINAGCPPEQPEQAEAERPEVVAWQYRVTAGPQTGWSLWHPGKGEEFERSYTVERRPLMTVAQHERIVKAWIERWKAYIELSAKIAAQRDAAQARVAELEKQDLVDAPGPDEIHQMAFEEGQPAEDGDGYLFSSEEFDLFVQRLLDSCAAPVAQAQHSVPEVSGIGRDFAYPRSVVLYLRTEPTDDDLRAIHDALRSLAAAPGKEVPQAWLDVQAERRRQITAEGWTPEHDDLYCAAELPRAAAAYILNGANDEAPAIWPFSAKWWKPRDARANYVRAAALILAEIERLDRAAPGKDVGHE